MPARENTFLSMEESAHYEGVSIRTMKRWIRDGKISPTKIKGKGRRKGHLENRIHYTQLSDKAQEAFLLDQGLLPEAKAEPKMSSDLKSWQKTTMLKRVAVVEEFLTAERDIPPGKKGGFQKHFAKMHGVSPQTLRRHLRNYKEGGREALAPLWTSGGSNRVITKEMEKFIHDDYMRPFGPPARETWERLCDAFKDKGPLPTYRTVAAHIKKMCPKDLQLLIRDPEAYNRKHSAYVPLKRPGNPNDLWYIDHKQLDIFIVDRGKAVRPWVTHVLDAASGKIVGAVVVITPDTDSIMTALVRAFRECGLPKAIYTDRGKDFMSHRFKGQNPKNKKVNYIEGFFAENGIKMILAAPKNPKEKGQIEATGNYYTSRMRGWPGSCGHNTRVRPKNLEALIKFGKLYTREECSLKFSELIKYRNAHPHSTTGKIPNDCYKDFTPIIPSPSRLAFMLMDVHQCKVRSSAIKIRETMYRHEDMWRLNGEEVEARRDPQDLRRAAIIYKDEFFCIAPEIKIGDYASPITKENVKMARRIKRSESQFKKKYIEQAGYIDDPLELAAHLSEKEREIEVIPRVQRAKVTSLHRKERLAKKIAEGFRDAPAKADARGKVTKISKNDRREQILGAFFGD